MPPVVIQSDSVLQESTSPAAVDQTEYIPRVVAAPNVDIKLRGGGHQRFPLKRLLLEWFGQVTAAVLFLIVAPLLLALGVVGRPARVRFRRQRKIGLHGREFNEYDLDLGALANWPFLTSCKIHRWPTLINVIFGQMTLVGPSARNPHQMDASDPRYLDLVSIKPGLICSWWIRCRRHIDYGTQLESDLDYIRSRGPKADLGLILRAALALVYGGGKPSTATRSRILGVLADNVTMDEALDKITRFVDARKSQQVCFVNADCLNVACANAEYRAALSRARMVLPDGIGVMLASRASGQGLRQNVNGTDLFPPLCDALARTHRRIFLLGAKPGVAEKVREYIHREYPGLVVAGVHHGYYSSDEENGLLQEIRDASPDVLLVAFGAPRQDVWIGRHLDQLGTPVAIGVGGLFDFFSFNIPRAPLWVRELGMEWMYRLLTEPRRLWRRYVIGNVVFVARVFFECTGLVHYGDNAPRDDQGDFVPEDWQVLTPS